MINLQSPILSKLFNFICLEISCLINAYGFKLKDLCNFEQKHHLEYLSH